MCENYHRYFNVRSIILRPFNIYGEGQNENFLIPMILNQAKSGKINLLDSRPKRDFIYIDDVIHAFKLAIDESNLEFAHFNIGYGKSYSVEEIVEIVNSLYDHKLVIQFANKERKNEVLDTVADISKAKSLLNWHPTVNIYEGIKRIVKNINGTSKSLTYRN